MIAAASNSRTQQVNTALGRTTIDGGGLRHDVVTDLRTKQVLREAVDAVVQSFSNHTRGYGRGEWKSDIRIKTLANIIAHSMAGSWTPPSTTVDVCFAQFAVWSLESLESLDLDYAQ